MIQFKDVAHFYGDEDKVHIIVQKPFYRKLNSMTADEMAELKWDKNNELKHAIANTNRSLYISEFVYLIKKRFDVFGLIESGQVLDIAQLKTK